MLMVWGCYMYCWSPLGLCSGMLLGCAWAQCCVVRQGGADDDAGVPSDVLLCCCVAGLCKCASLHLLVSLCSNACVCACPCACLYVLMGCAVVCCRATLAVFLCWATRGATELRWSVACPWAVMGRIMGLHWDKYWAGIGCVACSVE
jgi:hypothetical protein